MPRIVHLGTGNFHRAHQAWYTHLAGGWSIVGSSFRSPTIRDTLSTQGFNYTLVTLGDGTTEYQKIDVIEEILFAASQAQQLDDMLRSEETAIITLTITEKGYTTDGPIAVLANALKMRATPVTVISCDNLSGNGDHLKALVEGITGPLPIVTFPNSMVDRITPATTDELRETVREATGFKDQAPVATEPFCEWVIEDNFAGPRPDWHKVGVQFVNDVAPHELRKLRMLNGAHSYLAYAGLNAGYEFVHQAIADPILRRGAIALMDEAAQTLPTGLMTGSYRDALVTRFENPNLHHKLRQIAMDGTQKLPIRVGETIRALGTAPACLECIEAWAAFALNETKAGGLLDDPKADEIARAATISELKALL